MCESKPVLTLYGKPVCVQCDATRRTLDGKPGEKPVEYTYVDITEDEDAYNYVTNYLGYKQAPVVVARFPSGVEEHWSGFQPSHINDYKTAARKWGRDDS